MFIIIIYLPDSEVTGAFATQVPTKEIIGVPAVDMRHKCLQSALQK